VAHAFPHDPHDDKPKGDQGKGARLRHGGHFRNGDRRIEVRERARATETGGVAPEGRGGGTRTAVQHGPVENPPPVIVIQPVELPLRPNSVIGPAEEVALMKVVVSTTSWKLGNSNITSTLKKEGDVTW
jgi:hypothetical protein